MIDIDKIKAGETLFVSGAAGAVSSVTCQIGKIMGLKAVAIADSDDKIEWLKKGIGVDVAINKISWNKLLPLVLPTCASIMLAVISWIW